VRPLAQGFSIAELRFCGAWTGGPWRRMAPGRRRPFPGSARAAAVPRSRSCRRPSTAAFFRGVETRAPDRRRDKSARRRCPDTFGSLPKRLFGRFQKSHAKFPPARSIRAAGQPFGVIQQHFQTHAASKNCWWPFAHRQRLRRLDEAPRPARCISQYSSFTSLSLAASPLRHGYSIFIGFPLIALTFVNRRPAGRACRRLGRLEVDVGSPSRGKTTSLLAVSVSHFEEHWDVELDSPLGLQMKHRRPSTKRGMARWAADHAVDRIRDRFGWDAIGYGLVALGTSSSRPRRVSKTRRKEAVTVTSTSCLQRCVL